MRDDSMITIAANGKKFSFHTHLVALAIGISDDELIAEVRRNGGRLSAFPEHWRQQARRRARETAAKLNDNSTRAALIHFLKEEQG